jgi:RNA polymerase sigma-70 factor (ECF subfamily)
MDAVGRHAVSPLQNDDGLGLGVLCKGSLRGWIMLSDPKTFERYRPLLFSIAYRMLGSAMEAEDMVQEAYLRYEQAQREDIQSPKAYLSTIVTRLCLDHLKAAKTQREDYVGTWLPEPLPTESASSAVVSEHESISMAFLVLLESLSPIERAIFLLRDVFDYRYTEIAGMVGKSEANCRRYYHLAKQYLWERRPRFEPCSDEQNKLVESFLEAAQSGNVEDLTHMLTEEAVFYGDGGGKAPAAKQPIIGREAVIRFLSLGIFRLLPPETRIERVEVNGAPSLLFWGADDRLYFVMNFTIVNRQINSIRNILNPDKLAYIRQHSSLDGKQNAPK